MNGRYQSVQTFDEKSWARRAIIKGLFQVGTCEIILNLTSMLMMEDLTINSMQDVLIFFVFTREMGIIVML